MTPIPNPTTAGTILTVLHAISASPSKNIFWGRCDRCGEAYEAETTLEDLEGVRFQCKKMICDGQVQLKFTAMKDLPPPSQDKNPRRYC